MSIANDLLTAIESNIPEPLITGKYCWPTLAVTEREEILSYIQAGEPRSKQLLRIVAGMALNIPGCDPWDEARILSLGISHMGWNNSKRAIALKQLKRIIESLEREFSSSSPDLYKKCSRYQAGYWEANAQYLIDNDHLSDAISSYRQALEKYHLCGERKSEQRINQLIGTYEEIERNRGHLISIDEIELEKARSQKELVDLTKQCKQKNNELNRLQVSLQDFSERLEAQQTALKSERSKIEEELQRAGEQSLSEIHRVQKELEEHREHISQQLNQERLDHQEKLALQQQSLNEIIAELRTNNSALQFLMMLQEHTLTPLWLEVTKLALDQGEVDDLTILAIERLIPHYPDVAGPLTAEVFVRISESLPQKMPAVEESINSWMLELQKADQLLTEEPLTAARLVVSAWNSFLNLA